MILTAKQIQWFNEFWKELYPPKQLIVYWFELCSPMFEAIYNVIGLLHHIRLYMMQIECHIYAIARHLVHWNEQFLQRYT